MKYKKLIYLEDDAMMWSVVLQEDDGTAITLFEGLKRSEAQRLKERIDNAIRRRIDFAIKEFLQHSMENARACLRKWGNLSEKIVAGRISGAIF